MNKLLASPILLTGIYAWAITFGPSGLVSLSQVFTLGATRPLLSLGAGLLALGALLAGVALERARSRLAPLVGIWFFLAAMLLAWITAPTGIDIARIDSTRGALGAGGLTLYALSWGVPDVMRTLLPEDDPRADTSTSLEARDQLPRGARVVVALAMITAAALSYFAWRIRDVPRALFGQSLAALASVMLISTAAEAAVGRKEYHQPSPSARFSRASTSLLMLVFLGGLGIFAAYTAR